MAKNGRVFEENQVLFLRYFETDENNVSVAQSVLPKLKTKDNKPIEVPDYVTCKMGIKESREHGLMTQFDVQQVCFLNSKNLNCIGARCL